MPSSRSKIASNMRGPPSRPALPANPLPRRGDTDPDGPLTESQRQFVMNLVHFKLNNTAAARGTGVSQPHVVANEWLKLPKIQKAIAIERQEYAEATHITRKDVIDGLLEGISMGKLMSDPTSVIRGWREVGLMCGYYAPVVKKLDVTHSGEVLINKLQNMSDAELLRLSEENSSNPALDGTYREIADSGSDDGAGAPEEPGSDEPGTDS